MALTTVEENTEGDEQREGESTVIYTSSQEILSGIVTFEQHVKETKKSVKLESGQMFSRQW